MKQEDGKSMSNITIDNNIEKKVGKKQSCLSNKKILQMHERRIILFLFLLWTGLLLCSFLLFGSGCSTPFYSTDNKFLLMLPGSERFSDHIEGVMTPSERIKRINEKGEKGRVAPQKEKEIVILQLVQEYNRNKDPNIRRASLEALAEITTTTESPEAEAIFDMGFRDSVLGIRLSSVNAWGNYGNDLGKKMDSSALRKRSVEKLADYYRSLPYSSDAGARKANDEKKDIRLAILRNMMKFKTSDSPVVLAILEEGLHGEKLDDGALQVASMRALTKISGKNYGMNVDRWISYTQYAQGKSTHAPEELSLGERIPGHDLSMFK